jgi:hypothetical protein
MDVIPTSAALRLHSHEAWYDIQVAIRGASARGDDASLLHEELAKPRDVLRFPGRRERRRVISRTLLVKGLEYDHVIIADVDEHAKTNDLYVPYPAPESRSPSSGEPTHCSFASRSEVAKPRPREGATTGPPPMPALHATPMPHDN